MNTYLFRAGSLALLLGMLAAGGWLQAQPGIEPMPLLDKPRTNATVFQPLTPAADDGRIAQLISQLLARAQYLRQPFDDTVSSNFLARLIKDLDPQHMHFLQSDLKELDQYQTELDDLTMKYGDTTPAYDIFNRFVQRLSERVAYSKELLAQEKFNFTGDDRVVLNRKDLPFPKDLTEAKQLWRERVRFEYLQEKLSQPATNTAKALLSSNDVAHLAIGMNDRVAATNINLSAGSQTNRTPAQIHAEIVKTLSRRYDRTLKAFREWDSDNVLQFYLDTLAHVYDPHSDYMGKAAAEDFAINMNLSLFGIGALLTSEDGYCKIKELKPGPALKDGRMKNNDRIVAVAQGDKEPVDVVDMPLPKVVQLIRGPKGTEVRLTVIPADSTDPSARKVVALVRDEIKLEDQQAKAKLIELPGPNGSTNRLGVIDLQTFYAPIDNPSADAKAEPHWTSVDVAKLLKKLMQEKVNGVILDLRRNGGGSLEEAIKLTGLFIRRGTVVQVRDPNGIVMTDDDEDPDVLYDGPLVVLTSRFSASASEILVGALQDYGRALIVGDSSTHGKGTVQSLTQLRQFLRGDNWATNDPGAVKLTIRKFYRPSGSSTQLKGVIPDIVLPSVNNVAEVGETALDSALPWDTIQAAHIEAVNRVAPYLDELRQRSTNRVTTEKDFQYVREDVELYKKALADKTISLNEAQRLKEKDENEARDKARKQERAARPPKPETIYELTLKQAELPGLPPPTNHLAVATKIGTNSLASLGTNAPKSSPAASLQTPLASQAAQTTSHPEAEDDEDDAKLPPVDVGMEEAGRILTDYISLLPREAVTAANLPTASRPSAQE